MFLELIELIHRLSDDSLAMSVTFHKAAYGCRLEAFI